MFLLKLNYTDAFHWFSFFMLIYRRERQSEVPKVCWNTAMEWIVSNQNSYIEALTPTVIIFGDGPFGRQCIGLYQESLTLFWWYECLYKRRRDTGALSAGTQRKGHVRAQRVGGCLQARKRALTINRICRHLDHGLLASRTVRKINSVVWFTQFVVFYYGSSSSLIKTYNMIKTAKTWRLSLTSFCLQQMKFCIIWNTHIVILNNKQII